MMDTQEPLLPTEFMRPRLIGRGGFGCAYRADWLPDDLTFRRSGLLPRSALFTDFRGDSPHREIRRAWHMRAIPVVLKVYDLDASQDASDSATSGMTKLTFVHELDASSRVPLGSNHLVRTLGFRSCPRRTLILEYWGDEHKTTNLQEFISETPLDALESRMQIDFALQIARGLREAHAVEIVHADVKPANVFLKRRSSGVWHLRLGDFGAAKLPLAIESRSTEINALTPSFASPEVVRGGAPTKAADVYSFGMLVLSVGGYVVDGDRRNNSDVKFWANGVADDLAAHQPRRIRADVSKLLSEMLTQCLSGIPSRRPSASDCVRTLTHALKKSGIAPRAPLSLPLPKQIRSQVGEIHEAVRRERHRFTYQSKPAGSVAPNSELAKELLRRPEQVQVNTWFARYNQNRLYLRSVNPEATAVVACKLLGDLWLFSLFLEANVIRPYFARGVWRTERIDSDWGPLHKGALFPRLTVPRDSFLAQLESLEGRLTDASDIDYEEMPEFTPLLKHWLAAVSNAAATWKRVLDPWFGKRESRDSAVARSPRSLYRNAQDNHAAQSRYNTIASIASMEIPHGMRGGLESLPGSYRHSVDWKYGSMLYCMIDADVGASLNPAMEATLDLCDRLNIDLFASRRDVFHSG